METSRSTMFQEALVARQSMVGHQIIQMINPRGVSSARNANISTAYAVRWSAPPVRSYVVTSHLTGTPIPAIYAQDDPVGCATRVLAIEAVKSFHGPIMASVLFVWIITNEMCRGAWERTHRPLANAVGCAVRVSPGYGGPVFRGHGALASLLLRGDSAQAQRWCE